MLPAAKIHVLNTDNTEELHLSKKKILGLVGSYRKSGNTETVVKATAEKMGNDWQLSLIRLPKLKISPCKGCYACLLPDKQCNIKDDMAWLLECINGADTIIFAAPNYALAPVGIIKMISDRTMQALGYYESFKNKRTAVALTLGKEDYRGYADMALVAQAAPLGLKVVNLHSFYGTHPGETAMADDFQEKIQDMADSLVSEDYEKPVEPNRCPRCFSDLFRVHPQGLECAVCKALARQEGDTLNFFYFHPEFTEEGRMEHMKWLLMKKEEYPRLKDRLKEIQNRYTGGQWLSPSK